MLGFSTMLGSMCLKPSQPVLNTSLPLSNLSIKYDSIKSVKEYDNPDIRKLKTLEIENYTKKIQDNLQIIQNQENYVSEIVLFNDSIVTKTLPDSVKSVSYN